MKAIIGMLIVAVIMVMLLRSLGTDLTEELEKYETRIGDKVILKNDTLMIIDYSFWNSNFTLEDGRKISIDLLDKLEQLDK